MTIEELEWTDGGLSIVLHHKERSKNQSHGGVQMVRSMGIAQPGGIMDKITAHEVGTNLPILYYSYLSVSTGSSCERIQAASAHEASAYLQEFLSVTSSALGNGAQWKGYSELNHLNKEQKRVANHVLTSSDGGD